MTTSLLGQQGFLWFFGVVEDINDPRQLGRARIRVFNEHNEQLTTEELPWAQVLMPVTSESWEGIGDTPRLTLGSLCVGFFIDGAEKQLPVIMGTFPIIPGMDDTRHSLSYLARGKQTLQKDTIGPEPPSSYNAEYPHNRVIQTRSGHAIELDDTPNHERIHIYHKSGSYIEINNDGQFVMKSVKDNIEIVQNDKTLFCKGILTIDCEGNVTVRAKEVSIETDTLKVKADVNIQGNVVISGGLDVAGEVAGNNVKLSSHVHGGVQTGLSITTPPV